MDPEEARLHERHKIPQNVDLSQEARADAMARVASAERIEIARITQGYVEHYADLVRDADASDYPQRKAVYDRCRSNWMRMTGEDPWEGQDVRPRGSAAAKDAPPEVAERARKLTTAVEHDGHGAWLVGAPGAGKTSTATAMLDDWVGDGWEPGAIVTESDYLSALKAEFDGHGERGAARAFYASVPLLALDDVGAAKPTDWGVSEIFALVDDRVARGLPIVVTSNFAPSALTERLSIGEPTRAAAMVSRLTGSCRVVSLGEVDHRQDWRRGA